MFIRTKNVKIVVDEKEIMNRWKEHFDELLNADQTGVRIVIENNDAGFENMVEVENEEITEATKMLNLGKTESKVQQVIPCN